MGKYGKSSKDCDNCNALEDLFNALARMQHEQKRMFVLLLFRPKVVLHSMKRALQLLTLQVN